jgi:DNA-binding transcriptional ArsR family regulator
MDNSLTRTFQALADPTRREILRLLAKGDLSVGEIGANFDMALPSVSHHLSVLKNAELVTTERRGQSIVYSLNSTVAQEAVQELMALFKIGDKPVKTVRKAK